MDGRMAIAVSVFIAFSWKKKGGRLSDSTFMFLYAFICVSCDFQGSICVFDAQLCLVTICCFFAVYQSYQIEAVQASPRECFRQSQCLIEVDLPVLD